MPLADIEPIYSMDDATAIDLWIVQSVPTRGKPVLLHLIGECFVDEEATLGRIIRKELSSPEVRGRMADQVLTQCFAG